MIRFTSLFLFLFLLLLQISSSPTAMAAAATATAHRQPANIVNQNCEQSASTNPNVNYTFCVEALRSVARSRHADLRGLAIISLNLAKAEAKQAKARVKTLLKKEKEKEKGKGKSKHLRSAAYEESCLKTCRELYGDAMDSLRDSAKMVKSGRYGDANVYISSAVDAPGECEDGFREGGVASPLEKENYGLFQLAVLALSITSHLS